MQSADAGVAEGTPSTLTFDPWYFFLCSLGPLGPRHSGTAREGGNPRGTPLR